MKLQICVFVFYIFLSRIHINAAPTQCSIDGIDDMDWTQWFVSGITVDDNTPAGTVIFEADATGISSISTITEPNRYFEASIKDGKFTVTVTEKLALNFDEQETTGVFTETFRVLCGDESNDLRFRLTVNDINTHPPVFQNDPYEITIRLPLRTGDVITNSIVARDIDFTNTGIDFELSSNDFLKIETGLSTDKGKNHPAILTASRTVTSFTRQTIDITATDRGQPDTLSKVAQITLIPDAIPDVPSFEEPLYIGKYTADGTVDLNSLKLTNAYIDDDVVDYTVEQDVTGVFQVTKNPDNSISVSTNGNIGAEFLESFYIAFTIKAQHTDNDIKPGFAVVIINLPQKDLPECSEDLICPDSCPPVCVDCPVDCSLTCPPQCEEDCPVECSEDCPVECSKDCPTICATECPPQCEEDCPVECSEDCPFECSEDCPVECSKDCPTICSTECPPQCEEDCPVECSEDCPVECSKDCPTICSTECPPQCEEDCPVECSEDCPFECSEDCPVECSEDCPTVCATECPPQCEEDCPVDCDVSCPCNPNCPDPECPIDCSECPSNPPIGPIPQFRKDLYVAQIGVDHIGPITQVEADVEDGATLRYDAIYNEVELESKISIDHTTGEIVNTATISPGKYVFTVVALVVATGDSGKATVVLTIDSLPESCIDPNKQYASYALIVKHLDEETPYDDILPIVDNTERPKCEYNILSQVPDKGFFQISGEGKLICDGNIDRDDEEFYNNYGSQVQITLKIQCEDDSESKMNVIRTSTGNDSISAAGLKNNFGRNTLDGRDMIFATNIRMTLTETVLNIIIDDLNDNIPVFESDIPSYIGYPTSNLASKIMPPHVIVLKATDRDIGENAEISYKLLNSDAFHIHKKTGVVYPKDKVLEGLDENDLTFSVYAIDGPGKQSEEKIINVKLLSEDHVTILTIKRALPDDITDILTLLRTATTTNILLLHSAVVPSPLPPSKTNGMVSDTLPQSKLSDTDSILRLYIYALDTDNNPIESKELIKTIQSATLPWSTEINEFDKDDCDSECPENPECPTPTPGPGSVPLFEKPLYSFILGPREMKSWDIKAKTDPEEELEYWLNIDDLVLESCLSIDSTTGTVTVTSYVPPSNYQFTVHARAPSSENEAYTTISLVVTALALECPVDEIKSVANALNIITLIEEQEHSNILPLDEDNDKDCYFTLESQIPNKGFEISATNGLTCGKVDRDDKDFYEQYNSQVQLELELHCPDSVSRTILPSYTYENTTFIGPRYYVKKLDNRENGKHMVLTGNIKASLTRTTVSIIFEDKNDNTPIFTADTPSHIGYPLSNLASKIMPPTILTLQATDDDIGENAEISYKLTNTDVFYVHEKTGAVYPKDVVLDDLEESKLVIKAVATDRNGNADGNSSPEKSIQVKLLSEDHISILTIKRALPDDIADILAQLRSATSSNIYILHSGIIPSPVATTGTYNIIERELTQPKLADVDLMLRLYIYALDTNNNPIESKELIETIESVTLPWSTEINEFDKGDCDNECPENPECPTPTPGPGSVPLFEKPLYSFILGPREMKTWDIKAKTDPEEELEYWLNIDDLVLESCLSIDSTTGTVTVTSYVPPSNYQFTVHARAPSSENEAYTTISLVVTALALECPVDEIKSVANALNIITLIEEQEHTNILPLDEDNDKDCYFTLESQIPNKGFEISATNGLTCGPVDRDNKDFYEQYNSQVQLELELHCPDSASRTILPSYAYDNTTFIGPKYYVKKLDNRENGKHMVLTGNIKASLTRTTVSIIFEDKNDNTPIFAADTPSHIGYPLSNLASKIMTPSILTLQATDDDIGENAEISYKLTNTDVFYVHEKTGAVYPKDVVLDDLEESKLVITAVATDRNGNADGNSSPEKSIQVKLLSEDHISILTIKRALPDDIADILAQLRAATSSNIYVLQSAVIPSPVATTGTYNIIERELTQPKLADVDLMLRLYIYALDTDNNPIDSKELIKTIESATLPWSTEIIELDKDDCDSECPENPECPECPTPTPGPGSVPLFEKPLYSFILGPREMKTWDIKAKTDPEEELEYWLNVDDLVLESCLSIDSTTGTVTVTSYVPPSNYQFTVHARAPSSENEAYTTISLVVTAVALECPVDEIKSVANALNIITLIEEQEHSNILPLDEDNDKDCYFTLESQIPNKGFEISATNGLTCGKVDRDDKDFYEQYNSQVQLELELHCPDSVSRTILPSYTYENTTFIGPKYYVKKLDNRENGKHMVLTGNIKASLTRTTVSIIFEDKNDNTPIFTADTPSHIGYPLSNLASKIMPPSILTLQATDDDIGENAEISYKLTNTDVFYVHEKTGAVYPKDVVLDGLEESKLVIKAVATDRNGNADGNSSPEKSIQVKLLSEDHISILTIKRALPDDIADILAQLRSATSSNIYILHSGIIPSPVETTGTYNIIERELTQPKLADVDLMLRLYIYALDTDNNPIESKELIKTIESATLPWSTEIIELNKDDCDSECPENPECPEDPECPECPDNPECPEDPECPECPDNPECPECPECPTPTPGPGSVPLFEKPLYSFILGPTEMKSWDIKAKTDPEEALEYWFNIDDPVLKSCLSIGPTTGTVTVTSYVPPSNYQFTVHARAPSSENEAYTTVSLVVTALTLECPVDEIKAVANSLNIIQLDEEQEHLNILPLDPENDKDCTFTLESQIPNKGFEMSATNGLTCGKVDRDDKDFYEQYNSQVQLELELHCPDSASRTILPSYAYENTSFIGPRYHVKKLNARENGKYLVMTGNIKSSLTRTTVSVIFKDINDNAPVFDADTPTIIGYPLSELASQIMPPSLFTLKATDRDIGENAEIKYTLESESIFQIHPVTGVVYPKIQSLDSIDQEDLFFTATATDRNGAGLSSESIKITVKLLSSEHITVLTIKNALLEDADQVISQLSETLQRKLYALNAAVLPINSENNKQRQILRSLGLLHQRADSDESLLKLIVYGFDEKEELLQNEELIEAIEKSENSWDLSANEMTDQEEIQGVQDVTGYIVAVSILSVLIALIICGVFIVWWFIIRPKQNGFRQSHSELIQEDSPPSIQKNIWTTESEIPKATPVASQFGESPKARSLNELLDGNKNDSFETRNPSVSFVRLEDKEDNEDQKTSDGPARKKSVVTFNENVEKITIEKEENENDADEKARL